MTVGGGYPQQGGLLLLLEVYWETALTDQAPEITTEVTGSGEKPNYRKLVVLLILVAVLR
jgi:hypothetical protein